MTLLHRDYKTLKYSDTEYMVTASDDSGTRPGALCRESECNNYFYVTYGRQYFLLVNWDYTNSNSVNFEVVDLGGSWHKVKNALALSVALASGYFATGW